MAKLILSFLLFFFIASSSHARDLTDRSGNEISLHEFAAGTFQLQDSDSNSKPSIFLPSEKEKLSESEPLETIVDSEQEHAESNPSEISATSATKTTEADSDPLIMITFRPINRQFARRPVPLIFRRGRHRCRHQHHFKPWSSDGRVGEISYGNDMILSDDHSSLNKESDREMAIPSRWTEFGHVGPWDSYRNDGKEDRKHLHHHHYHHHQEDVKEKEKEEREEEHEHKETNGFLGNFRKFLNQFEF